MGDDIEDRLSQYAKLMSNKPDDWTRSASGLYMPKKQQTNQGALVAHLQKEMDQAYQAIGENLSRYVWSGVHYPLTPAEKRRLFWMRVKVIVTLREPRRRLRNAWLCLAKGWDAEDPDSRDY